MATLLVNCFTGILKYLLIPIPETAGTETITIKIVARSTGYTWNFTTLAFENANPVNTGAMLYKGDSWWQVPFNAPADGQYLATITDADNQITHYIEITAAGAAAATPASPLPGDLTSLANVKEYLGLVKTTYDNLLTNMISRASTFIKTYCRKTFAQDTLTKYYSGDNNGVLVLDEYPVISITSIHDDTERDFGADTLIDADDYDTDLEAGMIYLLNNLTFTKGTRNIKVIMVAGYTSTPGDIEQACIEIVARKYKNGILGKLGVTSESYGETNISYANDDIPKEAKAVLDRYRNVGI